jgi:hypothetical protein
MTWAGLETDKERCEFANGVFTERREDLEAAMRDAILKCQEQDGSPD